jgi:hypothetical protein
MTFDKNKFMAAKYSFREKEIPVPSLKDFFDPDTKPVWKIRNLTGVDIARADEAASKYALSSDVLEALMGSHSKKVQDSVKKILGKSEDIPVDIAKRVEHLQICSIDPVCDLDLALKICKVQALLFLELTNEILKLSGKGMKLGELKASGKTKKSKLP